MKLHHIAFLAYTPLGLAPALAAPPYLTVRVETPAQLVARCQEAWEHDQTVIEGGSCPSAREIMCAGPEGALIADDNPGLALFEGGRESRKTALAIEQAVACGEGEAAAFAAGQAALNEALTRGGCDDQRRAFACPPEDQDIILVPRPEWEAIELRVCGPNGSVSRDESGPVCDTSDSRCEALRRLVDESPYVAELIRAAYLVDAIADDPSLSGNGEDAFSAVVMGAEEALKSCPAYRGETK